MVDNFNDTIYKYLINAPTIYYKRLHFKILTLFSSSIILSAINYLNSIGLSD